MNDKTHKQLSKTVLERIEEERVSPKSRWYFVVRNSSVWGLWLTTVILGALAIAVTIFVMTNTRYALYEATHESFLGFLLYSLPYVWFVLFITLTSVAIYNLRHTKHGYRFAVWQITVSSMVLSLAGGALLQLFGFGYLVDRELGEHMDMYMSQVKMERALWLQPQEGRLLGRQVFSTTMPTTTIVFEADSGERWTVDVSELSEPDMALLADKRLVRVVGTTTSVTGKRFHACGAFPWMLNGPMSIERLSQERQAFMQRVYEHKERIVERLEDFETAAFTATESFDPSMMGKCADIATVRRLEAKMDNE